MLIDERLSHALFPGDWLFAQHVFGDQLDIATYVQSSKHHSDSTENFDAADAHAQRRSVRSWRPVSNATISRSFDVIGFTRRSSRAWRA